FVNLLHATSMIDVGESADPGAYFLRREKPSDHKLFSSTARLYAFPGAAGAKPPPPLFPFLPPGQPFAPAGAQPASHLETVVGTQHVFYDWDPAAGWRRAINGQPHVVEGGGQLIATNVVVQFVPWVPSPGDFDTLHSPVLVAQVVGSGDAWILAGGKVVKGHWSKPTPDAVTSYTGSDGQPVSFLPGRTWVELAGTEAQHVVSTPGGDRGSQTLDEAGPVVVVEHVEQPAVEDGVEALPKSRKLQGVGHEEAGPQPSLLGLGLRLGDGGGGGVHAGGVQAQGGGHEGVLPRPAADVQHPSPQGARLGQGDIGGLGPADVPRRGARVHHVELVALGPARLAHGRGCTPRGL